MAMRFRLSVSPSAASSARVLAKSWRWRYQSARKLSWTAKIRCYVRDDWWLMMMGRLKPGATVEQADARMKVLSPPLFGAVVPQDWAAKHQDIFRKYTFSLHAFSAHRRFAVLCGASRNWPYSYENRPYSIWAGFHLCVPSGTVG